MPLDAIVIDSPWETQYNTLGVQPPPVPGRAGADHADARRRRAHGGVGHAMGQPRRRRRPGAARPRVRAPAPRARAQLRGGRARRPLRARRGRRAMGVEAGGWATARRSTSPPTPPRRGGASRPSACSRSACRASRPTTARATTTRTRSRSPTGARAPRPAWAHGLLYRRSMQRALDEVHPGEGVLFGRPGWTGQQAVGVTWGGDQPSDFWSLRTLVAATLTAAACGFSNWSHDVGGYLGEKLVERCPKELLLRWVQFGCFTPLMHAHGRFEQEAWTLRRRDARRLPRVRAPARAARPLRARGGGDREPQRAADHPAAAAERSRRPARLGDGRRATATAPRCGSRRCSRPARASARSSCRAGDWIDYWTGEEVARDPRRHRRRARPARPHPGLGPPRRRSLVTYPAEHVAAGLGDTPEHERPLEATLWGEPRCGRALARLADGTEVRWTRGEWSVPCGRHVAVAVVSGPGATPPRPA